MGWRDGGLGLLLGVGRVWVFFDFVCLVVGGWGGVVIGVWEYGFFLFCGWRVDWEVYLF